MEWTEYQEKAFRTNAYLGDMFMDNAHMVFGLVTETAELADILKKYMAYGKDIDWTNFREEMGDIMWYIAGLCVFNDIDMGQILDQNIAKLEARYGDKFTEDKANYRDLDNERTILESNE